MEQACPYCLMVLGETTITTEGVIDTPKRGDFSICYDCGGILVYVDSYRVRAMEVEEMISCDKATRELIRKTAEITKAYWREEIK